MFPEKGTTVWVNFREKPYLGKVLQTSPEIDMVCVRIYNYLDHVTPDSETDFVAHSCPESNLLLTSNHQSSVVITCGFADICQIEPHKTPQFQKSRFDSNNDDIKNESDTESNSYIVAHGSTTVEIGSDNVYGKKSKPRSFIEDENYWSGFHNMGKSSNGSESEEIKNFSAQNKLWQCWYCQSDFSNENEMSLHVLNIHKLETYTDQDNWEVMERAKGIDYDEINYQEDTNIKSLNNIHISATSSRKRQFLESEEELSHSLTASGESNNISFYNSFPGYIRLDSSGNQDHMESIFKELKRSDICLPGSKRNHVDLDLIDSTSNSKLNPLHFNDTTTITNDQIMYDRKIQIFQSILQQHINLNFPTYFYNSANDCEWPNRLRSFSIPDQLISNNNQNNYHRLKEFQKTIISKKSRLETSVKKCRKMYGIDQRHLWCNQCKWKKACSRFSNEMHSN